jgi:pSer/pThr/pTyr-binding forkhead associated (FHA) protein
MRLGAVSGPQAGSVVDVRANVTIGRSGACSVVLDDPTVSRRHVRLAPRGRALVAADEGSLNGTWVNDRRIDTPIALGVRDRLRVGSSEFVVFDTDAQ